MTACDEVGGSSQADRARSDDDDREGGVRVRRELAGEGTIQCIHASGDAVTAAWMQGRFLASIAGEARLSS